MRLSHGSGSYLWMEGDNTPYLDLIMAFSSTNLGHAHPKLSKAVAHAATEVDNALPVEYGVEEVLSRRLIEQLPHAVSGYKAYYAEGGAKAVEIALEIAQIVSGKNKIVSFYGAFHGYSVNLAGVTDLRFLGKARHHSRQENNIKLDYPQLEKEVDVVIAELNQALNQTDVAAIIVETSQGLAGFRMAPERFFKELQAAATRTKTLLIVDDIIMGMGRTGSLYSFGALELSPDITILGKSLAGGYYPIAALIAKDELFLQADLNHSDLASTFSNNPFGIYIANEVQKIISEDNIFDSVAALAPVFMDMIEALYRNHNKHIITYNAWGFAAGFELKSAPSVFSVLASCAQAHIILQYAGMNNEYLRLSPSLLSTKEEFDIAYGKLDKIFSKIR